MKTVLSLLFALIISNTIYSQGTGNIQSPNANAISCTNWLATPTEPSYVNIGNLNITGDQITIEAVINRTQPYAPGIGDGNEGDIVSKHNSPIDVNYLLRPNHAYITTTDGYFGTPDICEIQLNKNYHIAMVYDGASLKFYRNGFLMSQVAATGDLIQNFLQTRIGRYTGQYLSTFIGYINEVRIWNVARTQTQIRSYMNTSLPTPATQTGLLAYYTFDNLLNKQGNASWNGALGGNASISATNNICEQIMDSCVVTSSCFNWLNTSAYPGYVSIGDLDITGNHITVEAVINRTQPYAPGGGNNSEGDIVSKHTDPPNVNYLLRPNHAYITTTNGFFGTPDICDLELNKNYHIAMVYDGATLKFYRNGFLMSQVNATGNLIQNDLPTQIGLYSGGVYSTQFLGYINDVRIWNISRTQTEILTFMNAAIPTPATQTGLVAYYTFDNLLNKQGNNSWDGFANGNAFVNSSNTDCSFFVDSCATIVPVTLTDFNVSIINNKAIKLNWQTASEFNISNYSVQRSTTGYEPDFISLGTVDSKSNSLTNKYSFIDNTAKPNTHYFYKLKINDSDGSSKSGPTRTGRITNKEFYTLTYPNPTTGLVKVFINNADSDASVKVIDQLGQTVMEKKHEVGNTNFIAVDLGQFSKGNYYILIQTKDNRSVEKIIKL